MSNAEPLEDDGLSPERRRAAVAVVVVGTVMAVLDGSIANVALPTISRELHVDPASAVWVVNAYQLMVTVLLIPLASLGDGLGYRTVYRAGVAVFTLGSLARALSHSLGWLIASRTLQGVGGAALMSIAPALNRTIFPARMLGVAVGISALTVAASSAAGPTVGGALLAVLPWPWLFAINVPLGTLDTFLAGRALPKTAGTGKRFDLPSAFLSGPAVALLVFALDAVARHTPPVFVAMLVAASVAFGFAFVRRQRSLDAPMLPLDVFANRRFSLAAATSLLSFTAQGVAFVALPFLLQNVYGYSPFVSGLLFTPWPLAIVAIAPIAGRLSDRMHPPRLVTAGLAVLAVGLALLALMPAHPSVPDVVWRMVVCGFGFGFFQSPNNREIMGAVDRRRSGSASGVLATVRVTGQSIGAALVAIALGTIVTTTASVAAKNAGAQIAGPAHLALFLAAAIASSACIASATRLAKADD